MDDLEERFYEIAAEEVASQNMAPGIMARALVDAEGDEKRAIAHYIRLRVEPLKARQRLDMLDKRRRLWTACRKCGFEGSMEESFIPPPDHRLIAPAVRCPTCGNCFDWYYAPSPDASTGCHAAGRRISPAERVLPRGGRTTLGVIGDYPGSRNVPLRLRDPAHSITPSFPL